MIKKAEATYKFFRSLKNLVDQGLIKSIDQAKAFAKQEFGEVSDLMTLQINKIFKNKNQPVVGKKDPIFDNTVETIPFDDTGTPFNPKDPQKVYGKPKIDESPAFPSYTKPKNRDMTPDEFEDFEMDIGSDNLEAYSFDGTVDDGARILKEEADYKADMFMEYKKGKLDPVAGDKSPARKRFLEKKMEEHLMSGDSKLMTREEIDELYNFDLGTDMDQMTEIEIKAKKLADSMSDAEIDLRNNNPYDTDAQIKARLDKASVTDDVDISQGMIDLDEMNFTKNAQAAKKAIDNASTNKEIKRGVGEIMSDTSPAALEKSIEIDNLMLKYEGMDRPLAETIATELNPQKKADIIAMVEQTIKMSEEGKSGSEIIDIFKKTPRTEQSKGGRIKMAKGGLPNILGF